MDGPRACLADELPALLAAANRVFRPSSGDMGRDYPLLFSTDNLADGNLRIIRDGGDIVAHAGVCLRRAALGGGMDPGSGAVSVAAVGAVFTRDDHRNRGLASAVVSDALARARAGGAALALVSGDGPLYRRLGFSPVPPLACWRCPPGPPMTHPDIPLPVDLDLDLDVVACPTPVSEAHLAILSRLNDAEPVHFLRTAADWRAIMGAATLFAWPARLFLVHQGGQPVAYLAVAQGARRRVLELAGDRGAVLTAAAQVADELVAPWHDGETAAHARGRGWVERALTLPMGSLWLDAPARPLPLPWYGLNYV